MITISWTVGVIIICTMSIVPIGKCLVPVIIGTIDSAQTFTWTIFGWVWIRFGINMTTHNKVSGRCFSHIGTPPLPMNRISSTILITVFGRSSTNYNMWVDVSTSSFGNYNFGNFSILNFSDCMSSIRLAN